MPNSYPQTDEQDDPQLESASPGTHASGESARGIGRTIVDGIAGLRSKISAAPQPGETHSDQTAVDFAQGEDSSNTPLADPHADHEKHIQRLTARLNASEAKSAIAHREADRLRKESESHQEKVGRLTRLLSSLRVDYDRIKQQTSIDASKVSAVETEATRLRVELVENERELQRVTSRASEAERLLAEEKQKTSALERVCMGLRRQVALAEEKAVEGQRLQDAILARETAETRLAEMRAEAERWRVKCGVTDALRGRAEAAERNETSLRDRISSLERELESREGIIRQGLIERRKLKEFMGKYERELEEKEVKLAKLRLLARKDNGRRRRTGNDGEDQDFGTAVRSETDGESNLSFGFELGFDKNIPVDAEHLVSSRAHHHITKLTHWTNSALTFAFSPFCYSYPIY